MADYYYFKAIEKVTAGVLDMFNNIYIRQEKYDKDLASWSVSSYQVPIEIGTKDNILKSYENNYQLTSGPKRLYTVPRMALMLTDIQKDILKQTNQLNYVKSSTYTDEERLVQKYTTSPSWYTANYNLAIITRRMDDMAQIVEQITPMFQGHLPLNIILIPEMDLCVTLPLTIDSGISFDMEDQIDEGQLRFVNSEIQMNVSVPFYPPISDSKVIKTIYSRYAALQGYDVDEWPDDTFTSWSDTFVMFGERIIESDKLTLDSDITVSVST